MVLPSIAEKEISAEALIGKSRRWLRDEDAISPYFSLLKKHIYKVRLEFMEKFWC
jgi:hypothetical protein